MSDEPSLVEMRGRITGLKNEQLRIANELDKLDHLIRGNGQEGMKTLMATQNVRIEELSQKINNLTRTSWSLVMVVLTQVIILVFKYFSASL